MIRKPLSDSSRIACKRKEMPETSTEVILGFVIIIEVTVDSLRGHLYKTETSQRTPKVGPCLSLLPLFDSL